MNDHWCGKCRFEKEEGQDYCCSCGQPLSIYALEVQYEKKTEFEEAIRNE